MKRQHAVPEVPCCTPTAGIMGLISREDGRNFQMMPFDFFNNMH
jgi:hypothetical protein